MRNTCFRPVPLAGVLSVLLACGAKEDPPPLTLVQSIGLKQGPLIACGPAQQLGTVSFDISGPARVKEDFGLGLRLLHSFEYDEAEKAFARVIEQEPRTAMAYWGVAMANFHPLWTAPTEAELKKGAQAVAIAGGLRATRREADYISAISAFYRDWEKVDHRTRTLGFEKAMATLYERYPDDPEAAIFYALALTAAADPTDKSFARQKKAGTLLRARYSATPDHPGVVHYLIHAYDYPGLAEEGLEAARAYASVAPGSAHALHMPSHIFTRLGMWNECVSSNLASVSSARCYAEAAGMKGHWDEEVHGLDYLVYAYLQKGANEEAKLQWDYLRSMKEVEPANFKVAYAYAAIPSRYLLENRLWKEAARMERFPETFPWAAHPWQRGMVHFTRLMGAVQLKQLPPARRELEELEKIRDGFMAAGDGYKAEQVAIQAQTGAAWIALREGRSGEALRLMEEAADREDRTEKHPVTPGAVIPAREWLGDMLLALNRPEEALAAYGQSLRQSPNRFNGLYGAGRAAEAAGLREEANRYYRQLIDVVGEGKTNRREVEMGRRYVEGML